MASTLIFSSTAGEHRWVSQIVKQFQDELKINIIPVCVYTVPATISGEKLEAYAPGELGFGPYHHLRPELHRMEREKLSAATEALSSDQIANFKNLVVEKLKAIEPSLRACYDRYLDLDGDTISWLVAIDGLFLLHHLNNYGNMHFPSGNLPNRRWAQDILMVENQIPAIALEEIERTTQFQPLKENQVSFSTGSTYENAYGFCQAHSPLKLSVRSPHKHSYLHLLDLMYHLIIKHRAPFHPAPRRSHRKSKLAYKEAEVVFDNIRKTVSVAASLGFSQTILKPFELIAQLPWADILGLCGKEDESDGKKVQADEIAIPSVSNLHKIAGIKFKATDGGIKDVEFDEEKLAFHLPIITINADSEVILRNLVAYEALSLPAGSTLELAEYVDMMCGIIDTADDVKLLRDGEILWGDLGDEEIAGIFNGITKSTGDKRDGKKKSRVEKAIQGANERYETRPRVKFCAWLRKCGHVLWRFLVYGSYVLLILLLILQAICQIYGCSNRWFGRGVASISSFSM